MKWLLTWGAIVANLYVWNLKSFDLFIYLLNVEVSIQNWIVQSESYVLSFTGPGNRSSSLKSADRKAYWISVKAIINKQARAGDRI